MGTGSRAHGLDLGCGCEGVELRFADENLLLATVSMQTGVLLPWRENLADAMTECHFLYWSPASCFGEFLEGMIGSTRLFVHGDGISRCVVT